MIYTKIMVYNAIVKAPDTVPIYVGVFFFEFFGKSGSCFTNNFEISKTASTVLLSAMKASNVRFCV